MKSTKRGPNAVKTASMKDGKKPKIAKASPMKNKKVYPKGEQKPAMMKGC